MRAAARNATWLAGCSYSQQNNAVLPAQLEEMLRFMSDQTEARATLYELATRLTGDVESLKQHNQSKQLLSSPVNGQCTRRPLQRRRLLHVHTAKATALAGKVATAAANYSAYSNTPGAANDKTWGSRRHNKKAQYGRFETQQQLDAEIRAKQQIMEELRRTRTRCDEADKQLIEQRKRLQQLEHCERENAALRERLGVYAAGGSVAEGARSATEAAADGNEAAAAFHANHNLFVDHGQHPMASTMQRYNPAFFHAIGSSGARGARTCLVHTKC